MTTPRMVTIGAASLALAAGVVAVALRQAGETRPISDCEKNCMAAHPDDLEARLSCMLKCVADGKLSLDDVFTRRFLAR